MEAYLVGISKDKKILIYDRTKGAKVRMCSYPANIVCQAVKDGRIQLVGITPHNITRALKELMPVSYNRLFAIEVYRKSDNILSAVLVDMKGTEKVVRLPNNSENTHKLINKTINLDLDLLMTATNDIPDIYLEYCPYKLVMPGHHSSCVIDKRKPSDADTIDFNRINLINPGMLISPINANELKQVYLELSQDNHRDERMVELSDSFKYRLTLKQIQENMEDELRDSSPYIELESALDSSLSHKPLESRHNNVITALNILSHVLKPIRISAEYMARLIRDNSCSNNFAIKSLYSDDACRIIIAAHWSKRSTWDNSGPDNYKYEIFVIMGGRVIYGGAGESGKIDNISNKAYDIFGSYQDKPLIIPKLMDRLYIGAMLSPNIYKHDLAKVIKVGDILYSTGKVGDDSHFLERWHTRIHSSVIKDLGEYLDKECVQLNNIYGLLDKYSYNPCILTKSGDVYVVKVSFIWNIKLTFIIKRISIDEYTKAVESGDIQDGCLHTGAG